MLSRNQMGVAMPDRVAEILEGHIKLAERQLDFVKEGTEFFKLSEVDWLPITEDDLIQRIATLRDSLEKHKERHANGT
jgi:hypothetical protein